MSLKGTDASEFALNPAGCEGKTLAGHASCVVQVRLAPTSPGHKTAEVVAEAPGTSPAVASISANALEQASLSIQPASQTFGTVGVTMSSNPFFFLVTNTGQADSGALLLQTTGTHAQDFEIVANATTCTDPLAPGATCNVAIVFTPSAVGNRTAALQVQAAPGGTAAAQLAGEGGNAQLSIDPSSHDFGTAVGTTRTFTVENNGGADTGALQAVIQGTDPADFSIESDQCNYPLSAGATCTVQVRFQPTSSGLKTASLEVSASPGGAVVAQLTGTNPQDATLTLSPSSQDFGTVLVNGSSTRTFTLGNSGGQTSGRLVLPTPWLRLLLRSFGLPSAAGSWRELPGRGDLPPRFRRHEDVDARGLRLTWRNGECRAIGHRNKRCGAIHLPCQPRLRQRGRWAQIQQGRLRDHEHGWTSQRLSRLGGRSSGSLRSQLRRVHEPIVGCRRFVLSVHPVRPNGCG